MSPCWKNSLATSLATTCWISHGLQIAPTSQAVIIIPLWTHCSTISTRVNAYLSKSFFAGSVHCFSLLSTNFWNSPRFLQSEQKGNNRVPCETEVEPTESTTPDQWRESPFRCNKQRVCNHRATERRECYCLRTVGSWCIDRSDDVPTWKWCKASPAEHRLSLEKHCLFLDDRDHDSNTRSTSQHIPNPRYKHSFRQSRRILSPSATCIQYATTLSQQTSLFSDEKHDVKCRVRTHR